MLRVLYFNLENSKIQKINLLIDLLRPEGE